MTNPPLGEQQLELLKYLADHAPVSVREMSEQFGEERGLARTTVLTMMEKLRLKGYVVRKRDGRVWKYSPAIAKADVMQQLVRGFVERTLGGSIAPFVAYLTKSETLRPEEIADLERMVRELKQENAKED